MRIKTDDWFTGLQKLIRRHGIRYNPGNALKVAVLDTGINMDGCWNFVEYEKDRVREKASFMDSDGRADVDKDGHGSRIAAIILRLTKNIDLYITKDTNSEYIGQAEVVKNRTKTHLSRVEKNAKTNALSQGSKACEN